MTKTELRKALAKKGIFSIAEFGRRIGIKDSNIHKAISEPDKYPKTINRIMKGLESL